MWFRRTLGDGEFQSHVGTLFLDCDPTGFEHVLYFLRHGRLASDEPLEKVMDIASHPGQPS